MRTLLALTLLAAAILSADSCISMPYDDKVLADMQKQKTSDGVKFGTPVIEDSGKAGRRMAWCHPFSEEAKTATKTATLAPLKSSVQSASLPDKWEASKDVAEAPKDAEVIKGE